MAEEMKLRITVDDKGSVAINNMRQHIRDLGKDSAAASAAMSSFKAAAGGLISAAAVMGLVRLGKEAMDAMDRIDELSQQTGVAAESIQIFGNAGRLSGIDMDAMAKSMGKLSKSMYEAAGGSEDTRAAFSSLGVNIKESDGTLRTLDDVMLDLADAFEKMPDGTQKSALAMKAFGKSGAELIPFLNQGREGLEAMKKEMEALGMVIDGKAIRQAGELNDKMDLLGMAMKVGVMKVMVEMLPVMENLVTAFGAMAKEGNLINDWAKNAGSFFKGVASVVLVLAQAFDTLGTSIGETLARGQKAYEDSSWLAKFTGVASIRAGVAGFAGGVNDPNSALAQKSASYAKIWDTLINGTPGNMLALPARARGGGESPSDKGAESRAKQIASITESWASKMIALGTDMAALYQDDLTRAIIDIEAKAAAMYAEADKAARTHGVTLDTSIIGKWKDAMLANAEYQAELKATESILSAMAATAERQAAIESSRLEWAASRASSEAAAYGDLKKGYIDLAVTMGQISQTDAIQAKYEIEKAILALEWKQIAALSEKAVLDEDLLKTTKMAYDLKLKETILAGKRDLDLAGASAEEAKKAGQLGEDIAGALNNALADFFFDPVKASWENLWTSLRRIAAKALADMVTDWIKASMKMSSEGGGCFGGLFGWLFGKGGTGASAGYAMQGGDDILYHSGGPVRKMHRGGLMSDEVPAILQTGEYVMSRQQVAAVKSGGQGRSSSVVNNITINATDAQSFANMLRTNPRAISDALSSAVASRRPIRRK